MTYSHLFICAAVAAPQSNESQLLDLDGTVYIMLAIFLLAVAVLSRWLWRPYLRVREERVTRVEGFREEAARMDADAEARLQRCQADLAEARRAGSHELARARNQAQIREQAILAGAQAQAQRDLAAARARIETALAAEKSSLAARAQALGAEAAERILGRKVAR